MGVRALDHIISASICYFRVLLFILSTVQSRAEESPQQCGDGNALPVHYSNDNYSFTITNACFPCAESWHKEHGFWSHRFQENEILQLLSLPVSKVRSSSEGGTIN